MLAVLVFTLYYMLELSFLTVAADVRNSNCNSNSFFVTIGNVFRMGIFSKVLP